jgi:hypothetical protein
MVDGKIAVYPVFQILKNPGYLPFRYGSAAQFAIETVGYGIGDVQCFVREKSFADILKSQLESLTPLAAIGFGRGSRHVITSVFIVLLYQGIRGMTNAGICVGRMIVERHAYHLLSRTRKG